MAQLIVRNLDEGVKTGLKRRARRNGRSMEEEVRDILRDAVKNEQRDETAGEGLGTLIARRFTGRGIDFEIPELRGEWARPVKFEE